MEGYDSLDEALSGQNGIDKFKDELLKLKEALKSTKDNQDELR
jgi:hypothetical protein